MGCRDIWFLFYAQADHHPSLDMNLPIASLSHLNGHVTSLLLGDLNFECCDAGKKQLRTSDAKCGWGKGRCRSNSSGDKSSSDLHGVGLMVVQFEKGSLWLLDGNDGNDTEWTTDGQLLVEAFGSGTKQTPPVRVVRRKIDTGRLRHSKAVNTPNPIELWQYEDLFS